MVKIKKRLKIVSPSLIIIFLAVFLGLASNIIRESNRIETQSEDKWSDQLIYKESLARSLDLRVSSKALYPGGNIHKTVDLGIKDQVYHYVISFPVPNDNLKEFGLMTVPLAPPSKNGYPLIILCHGYISPSEYSTTSAYVSDMEFYSRQGFVVIKPDFRGQGQSIDSGRPEGAYFSMAYNTDLMNLISSAKRLGYIDKSNISLWGHSMGAYISLRASIMSPDVKNVVLLSGVVGNENDLFGTFLAPSDSSNPTARAIRQKMLLKHGSSLSNFRYWSNVSPQTFLKNSKAYYQIYVGALDTTVPPIFSAHLDESLNSTASAHYYKVFPQGDHGLVGERPYIWAESLKKINSH